MTLSTAILQKESNKDIRENKILIHNMRELKKPTNPHPKTHKNLDRSEPPILALLTP